MIFIKHLILFIKNNVTQLRRKWLSLPLLLLFPVIMIAFIAIIILAFIPTTESDPIEVGIVDLDQSNETTVIVNLISEISELGNFMTINHLSESEANQQLEDNLISTYIMFPDQFTRKLYNGESVSIPMIGNPNQPTESYIIKEIIDSATRHISAAQASILTINHYAKKLDMDNETRNDMLFAQFTDFLLYTIGKDKIIDSSKLSNHATTSPIEYYGLAGWFMIIIVWLLLLYNFLHKEESVRMKQRMTLYGVTELQQIFARIFVTLFITGILAIGSFGILKSALQLDLFTDDYIRILCTLSIHSIIFLVCLAIIDTIIPSDKLRLLMQSLVTFIVIIMSGAIVPSSYFPLPVQDILPYTFSHLGFYWIQEVVLNERLYVDLQPLVWIGVIGLLILIGCSLWKERMNR